MPKVWDFNEAAVSSEFNDLVADRPREYHLAGAGIVNGRKIETTDTSEPGTANLSIPVDTILGTFLLVSFSLKADSGGKCFVRCKLRIGATEDTLFTETTLGIRDQFNAVDITGLANNGDVRGESGVFIEFYVWRDTGGADAEFFPGFLKSGEFSAEADNWWFPLNTDA